MKVATHGEELSSDELYFSKLANLMEEQVHILRRMDERQTAADLSKQPMPEVPATSSSAWNALLRSTLADTIQPKVDRWRSGLDALLVFLGLFSAIVTSFFVQSLTALKEDQAVRMNELVTNLTEIIIVLSPVAFHPDSTDVRLNSFWSLSLILSLSIAALAVACRAFLNMVGWSRYTKASEKLIDIRTRLLDTLFSSVLQLQPAPKPILFTSGVSLLFISAVAVLLCYTLAHRSLNPTGSLFRWTVHHLTRNSDDKSRDNDFPNTLSERAPSVYHEVVQATHDDDTLNYASAALYDIIQSLSIWPRYGTTSTGLLDQERGTFLHLLSPEASTRSNRTAVQVICRIQESNRIRYTPTDMFEIIPVLLQAARRSPHAGSILELWDSAFIRAMAIVANAGAVCDHHPPVLSFLSSEYIDNQHLPSNSDPSAEYDIRTKTISFVVEILFTKLTQSLADPQASETEDEIVSRILSPLQNTTKTATSPTSPTTTTAMSALNPGKIIAALIYIPGPRTVLRAIQAHVTLITSHDVWPTILFFIASIAGRVCLATDAFRDHIALAELCVRALLKIGDFHQFHPQLPALVATAVAALRHSGIDAIAPQMLRDLLVVRKFVGDDTWRWSTKQRSAVLVELESLDEPEKSAGSPKNPIYQEPLPNNDPDINGAHEKTLQVKPAVLAEQQSLEDQDTVLCAESCSTTNSEKSADSEEIIVVSHGLLSDDDSNTKTGHDPEIIETIPDPVHDNLDLESKEIVGQNSETRCAVATEDDDTSACRIVEESSILLSLSSSLP
ncbi:hypothetical protein B0H19DRAFT_1186976 [Mycena capillaripes]|nr:hypothetical protein B0H19DRAFT_1186976 [Mycena capillaripes]